MLVVTSRDYLSFFPFEYLALYIIVIAFSPLASLTIVSIVIIVIVVVSTNELVINIIAIARAIVAIACIDSFLSCLSSHVLC